MKLLFVVTEDWYFASHRLALGVAAQQAGFDVVVATRFSEHRKIIEECGLRAVQFEMNRRGLNPFALFREAVSLAAILRREHPDIVHLVALRPVVVGALAARLVGIKGVVSAVTGMGFLFAAGGRLPWIRGVLQKALPSLLSRGLTIVQNGDDGRQLQSFGLSESRLRHIPGAGVDIDRFTPTVGVNEPIVVMMACRLLWDKGVGEFVEAARMLNGRNARFVLVGAVDSGNPAAISDSQLQRWVAEGVVEWWGHSKDMAATLSQADIYCLPSSYREGMPKVLLEAMACGKACVTTDAPGCRDAVRNGDNGLLVPIKDAVALAAAIARLIDDPASRGRMGMRGRERAVQEFSQQRVIEATLAVYREVLA